MRAGKKIALELNANDIQYTVLSGIQALIYNKKIQ